MKQSKIVQARISPAPVTLTEEAAVVEEPVVEETPVEGTPEVAQETAAVEEVLPTEAPAVKVTEEEAPAVEEVVAAAPVEQPAPVRAAEAQVSMPVRFLRDYIRIYTEETSKPLPIAAKCNDAFEQLMRHAIRHQASEGVLDELYAFFLDRKDKLLNPRDILSGLPSSKRGVRERIQTAYMLFYDLLKGNKAPVDFEYAAQILEGHAMINFVRQRRR